MSGTILLKLERGRNKKTHWDKKSHYFVMFSWCMNATTSLFFIFLISCITRELFIITRYRLYHKHRRRHRRLDCRR